MSQNIQNADKVCLAFWSNQISSFDIFIKNEIEVRRYFTLKDKITTMIENLFRKGSW